MSHHPANRGYAKCTERARDRESGTEILKLAEESAKVPDMLLHRSLFNRRYIRLRAPLRWNFARNIQQFGRINNRRQNNRTLPIVIGEGCGVVGG